MLVSTAATEGFLTKALTAKYVKKLFACGNGPLQQKN